MNKHSRVCVQPWLPYSEALFLRLDVFINRECAVVQLRVASEARVYRSNGFYTSKNNIHINDSHSKYFSRVRASPAGRPFNTYLKFIISDPLVYVLTHTKTHLG